jgi:hypothetical protein
VRDREAGQQRRQLESLRGPNGGRLSRSDLDGLTFYVANPAATRVTVKGREVTDLSRNPPDETGAESVSIPWRRLEFPNL